MLRNLYFCGKDKEDALRRGPMLSKAEAVDFSVVNNDPDATGPYPVFVVEVNVESLQEVEDALTY